MPRATRKVLAPIDNAIPAEVSVTTAVKAPAKSVKQTSRARAGTRGKKDESATPVTFAADQKPATASKIEEENKALKATIEELTSKLASVTVAIPSATAPAQTSTTANEITASVPAPGPNRTKSSSKPFAPFGVQLPVPQQPQLPIATGPGAPPTRPPTAYQAFVRDNREEVRASNPDATFGEINQKLGALWNDVKKDPKQLAHYEAAVAESRARYEAQMVDYKQRVQAAEVEKAALERKAEKLKTETALAIYQKLISGDPLDMISDTTTPAGMEAGLNGSKAASKAAASAAVPEVKKARSAYLFFSAKRHEELNTQEAGVDAGEKMPFKERAALISQEWAALGKSRRKADKNVLAECNRLAAGDAERFQRETAEAEQARAEAAAVTAAHQEKLRQEALAEYAVEQEQVNAAEDLRKMKCEQLAAEKAERKKDREEKKAAKLAKAAEPKRARSGYQLFFSDHATEISAKIKSGELEGTLTGAVGAMWKAANEGTKQEYAEKAALDKERYQREMADFNANKQ